MMLAMSQILFFSWQLEGLPRLLVHQVHMFSLAVSTGGPQAQMKSMLQALVLTAVVAAQPSL
jgi:hypothetical protein